MKTVVSWETPPKEDEKFVLFTEGNFMHLFESMEDYRNRSESVLKGKEPKGWLPFVKDKNAAGFPAPPPVNKK